MKTAPELREVPKHIQDEYAQLFDHDKYEYRWVKVDGITRGDLGQAKPGEEKHSVLVLQRKLKA